MAAIERPKTPLDETFWHDQAWYRAWGPLNHMTVMDYFRMSTFFDNTSNNGNLFQQMQYNLSIREELSNIDLFNARLRQMTGVEYMLATGSTDTGVWVIRKQLRRPNKLDENTGREAEDVTVLATYYITGENIFQAPSVGAVLQSRMLTAINALRSAQKIATTLSSFTPTRSAPSSSQPAPSSQSQSQSQPPPSTQSSATAAAPQQQSSTSAYLNDPNLLTRSLQLSLRHQEEFMEDHAPLLGDPGSFLAAGRGAGGGRGGGGGGGAAAVGGGKEGKGVGRGVPAAVVAAAEKKVLPPMAQQGRRKSKGAGL